MASARASLAAIPNAISLATDAVAVNIALPHAVPSCSETNPSAHNGAPSAQLQGEIDSAVRTLITHQAARAESIVRDHADALDAIARALIEHGVLMAADVLEIAEHHGVPVPQVAKREEVLAV